MRFSFIRFIAVTFAILFCGEAMAATITPTVLASGRVRDVNGTAFGPTAESTLFEVFRNLDGFITNSVLEVSLLDVPSNQTVDSATFSFTDFAGINNVSFFAFAGNGTLEVSDGLEFGTLLANVDFTGSSGQVSLSASVINALIDAGENVLGINITGNNISNFSGFFSGTLTFETSSTSVVPVPAALPLFGTGLAIMGFIGWRRKRKLA